MMTNTTATYTFPNQTYMYKNRLQPVSVEVLVGIDTCFILLCIAGNFFVLVTTLRTKSLQTPSFYLILSIVIAHLLTGFVILPMFIVSHYPENYMTDAICKIVMYSTKIAANVNIMALFPVTYDGFRKNSRFHKRYRLSSQNAGIQIAVVWALAIGYAVFHLIIFKMVERVHSYDGDKHTMWNTFMCDVALYWDRAHRIYITVDMCILYIIPLLVLGTMNILIWHWQWRGHKKHGESLANAQNRNMVTSAGATFLIIFLFCNIGKYTLDMFMAWGPGKLWDIHLIQSVMALIAYAQSWLNVLLLLVFNKPFRRVVLKCACQVQAKEMEGNHPVEMIELRQNTDKSEEKTSNVNMGNSTESLSENPALPKIIVTPSQNSDSEVHEENDSQGPTPQTSV